MNESKKIAVSTEVEVERPNELVLHFQECDSADPEIMSQHASGALRFFSIALKSAAAVPGLRRITLDLPEGMVGKTILEDLGKDARAFDLELCALVQFEQVEAWGEAAFSCCREVALRMDTRQFPGLKLSTRFYDRVESLQAHSRLEIGRASCRERV